MNMSSVCIDEKCLLGAQGTRLEEGFSKWPVHCNEECLFSDTQNDIRQFLPGASVP